MFLLHSDRDINISALLDLDRDWMKMHGMEGVKYNRDDKKVYGCADELIK